MPKSYFVYIITNKKDGVLYTGMTNNLNRRVDEHKKRLVPGFTKKYHLEKLVFFEETPYVSAAIAREKQIKGWLRKRKIELIEALNPDWRDLSGGWYE